MIHLPPFGNGSTSHPDHQRPPSRRKLYVLAALLVLHLLLLVLVFPWLIIYFEEEHIRQELEEAPEKVNASDYFPSCIDGLYWSLKTPMTMDAGGPWPLAPTGRILVRISDVTKLLTMVVLAWLFHQVSQIRQIY